MSDGSDWDVHYQNDRPPWETGRPSEELERVVHEDKIHVLTSDEMQSLDAVTRQNDITVRSAKDYLEQAANAAIVFGNQDTVWECLRYCVHIRKNVANRPKSDGFAPMIISCM